MNWAKSFTIGNRTIGLGQPTYLIADVASSHDGELSRAVDLIWKAAEAGADCAKFQHFLADRIVSDVGFKALGGQLSHQATWTRSVYEVFKAYETPRAWTETLVETCAKAGIDFMTTPYDSEAVDLMRPFLKAWKIGSGDITWTDFLKEVARQGAPVFLATGASTLDETQRAVATILAHNSQLCLMQCNTNYTGSHDNFAAVNLNVLKQFAALYPGLPLGLSDHTPGHAAVLGAVALGACAIEKHFTDDNDRDGPDHPFSMNPTSWRDMVDRTRELEAALGNGKKLLEENETDSVVVQRRALRLTADRPANHVLAEDDLVALRPCPPDAFPPWQSSSLIGRTLACALGSGMAPTPQDLVPL